MGSENDNDDTIFDVVVNHEQQYSIWPLGRSLPLGWTLVGKTGKKQDCLDHIEAVWSDMRPLSARRRAEALADTQLPVDELDNGPMLVERLIGRSHPVRAEVGADRTAAALKACIERGYVRLVFTHDRGDTTLGIKPNLAAGDSRHADFDAAAGCVQLEGNLILDGEAVRCIIDLELASLTGSGRLLRTMDESR